MSDPKEDFELLNKVINESNRKKSCPHEGKKYCEYPYCSCKENKLENT